MTPRFAYFTAELAAVASDLAGQLEGATARRLSSGKIDQAAADHGRRVMMAIAGRWTIAAGGTAQVPETRRYERVALLERAVEGARRSAAKAEPAPENADYLECVETLLWWERRDLDIGTLNQINAALRPRAAQPEGIAA